MARAEEAGRSKKSLAKQRRSAGGPVPRKRLAVAAEDRASAAGAKPAQERAGAAAAAAPAELAAAAGRAGGERCLSLHQPQASLLAAGLKVPGGPRAHRRTTLAR